MKRLLAAAVATGLSASLLAGCESAPDHHEERFPAVSCSGKPFKAQETVGSYVVRTVSPGIFQPIDPHAAQLAMAAAVQESVDLHASGSMVDGQVAMVVNHDRTDLFDHGTTDSKAMWGAIETIRTEWGNNLQASGVDLGDGSSYLYVQADFTHTDIPLDQGRIDLKLFEPDCQRM